MPTKDEDEFEIKYIKYFTIILGGGFVLGLIIWMSYLDNKNSKYTSIEKPIGFEKQIKDHERGRGILYLDFDDNSRYTLTHYAFNYEYDPPDLFSFIVVGDVIEKKAGTDTIIVKRQLRLKTKKYFFVIGQDLNKEMERR